VHSLRARTRGRFIEAMGTDDWYGRERGFAPGETANLVYAADFDANEIELLELPDELLQRARDGEELIFKGGPDEEAVLCTSDTTYLVKRVETSNTLLLMRGKSGVINDATERDVSDPETGAFENEETGGEGNTEKKTPTPRRNKRRRNSEVCDGPITPSTEPRPAHTVSVSFTANEDGNDDLIAHAQAESYLEVRATAPRFERMWEALSSRPHAFAGVETDEAFDRAWGASLDDGDIDENGSPDPPVKGLTETEVIHFARASRAETREALRKGPAFLHPESGRWRGIDPEYLDHLLDVLLVTADANGWPFDRVPGIEMCEALVHDGFPYPAAEHALRRFCEDDDDVRDASKPDAPRYYSVDGSAVCRAKASRLLDVPMNATGRVPAPHGTPRWRLDAFLEKWRSSVPESLKAFCVEDSLRGLALIETASDAGKPVPVSGAGAGEGDGRRDPAHSIVRVLKAEGLPKDDPKRRFAALWNFKPRWTLKELTPYLEATAEFTVEAQLLKFTRVTQRDAKATATYSKR